MNYMRVFTNLKEDKQPKQAYCQKDKEGDVETQGMEIRGDPTQLEFFVYAYKDRFLSSWLGPGVVEMVISGQGPTQIIYHQCLTEAS